MIAKFDVVCCITLARRPERWRRFIGHLPADWPFKSVLQAEAVDGRRVTPPAWWTENAGAWGCYRSHLRVFEQALNAGATSLFVLEDDAVFRDDFAHSVRRFFDHLPDDWQMVYLGGQLIKTHFRPPEKINDWCYRPYNVNRAHAYAVRGEMLRTVYHWLCDPGWYSGHMIDHHLGRLHESGNHNVYVPARWLVGQAAGESDILARSGELRFWPEPEDEARRSVSRLIVVMGDSDSSHRKSQIAALEGNGVWFGADSPSSGDQCAADRLLDSLCTTQTGGQPTMTELELSDRLSDWLGRHLWEAEQRGKTAGAARPQFGAWMQQLKGFLGEALEVISA